jgi:hypothetical protein
MLEGSPSLPKMEKSFVGTRAVQSKTAEMLMDEALQFVIPGSLGGG